jgi:hypothetical protein
MVEDVAPGRDGGDTQPIFFALQMRVIGAGWMLAHMTPSHSFSAQVGFSKNQTQFPEGRKSTMIF